MPVKTIRKTFCAVALGSYLINLYGVTALAMEQDFSLNDGEKVIPHVQGRGWRDNTSDSPLPEAALIANLADCPTLEDRDTARDFFLAMDKAETRGVGKHFFMFQGQKWFMDSKDFHNLEVTRYYAQGLKLTKHITKYQMISPTWTYMRFEYAKADDKGVARLRYFYRANVIGYGAGSGYILKIVKLLN